MSFHTGHIAIYLTSIDLFIDDPIIGKGIKSFRNSCSNKFIYQIEFVKVTHIIYFRNINDTGIIGLMTILFR